MWKLFKDKNDINEKNIIGFISFAVMVLFAITDLITGMIFMGYVGGGEFVINDTIYNSFVMPFTAYGELETAIGILDKTNDGKVRFDEMCLWIVS